MRATPRGIRVRNAAVIVLALALLLTLVAALSGLGDRSARERCVATVDGGRVELSTEQMGHAATITAIAVRRGLPARAATIALATAFQESKIENIDYGDRDSLGLFQQRPSQGWGTPAQVQDPVYATNAFYDGLVKVDDYRTLPITEAAQAVQRSGFPDAYAQHETRARVLASALSGSSPASLGCVLDDDTSSASADADADRLSRAVAAELPRAGSQPVPDRDGVRLQMTQPAHVWVAAHWAVARADSLAVERVYADGRMWSRGSGKPTWETAAGAGVPPRGSREVVVLQQDTAPA